MLEATDLNLNKKLAMAEKINNKNFIPRSSATF